MFLKEVKDAFHFILCKKQFIFQNSYCKTDERFYSITNSLTKKEIEEYDKLKTKARN